MIVSLIVPLFPRTFKAPVIEWEVGKSITSVCGGVPALNGCSVPRAPE